MVENLKDILLKEAEKINVPDFVLRDPVQFAGRFSEKRDIEIVSLLVAHISWGNRQLILRDAERLLDSMDNQPYRWLMSGSWKEMDDSMNIHRTFFASHLKYMLSGLKCIYDNYGTLDDFCRISCASESDSPPWKLAEAINAVFCDANAGEVCPRALPLNLRLSPLKRLNMALRWLVRKDNIVDYGIWESLTPRQLFIPLDVHVGNVSRKLGLISRKANDRRTCEELTDKLRQYCPDDPVLLDFALFGLGVSGRIEEIENLYGK